MPLFCSYVSHRADRKKTQPKFLKMALKKLCNMILFAQQSFQERALPLLLKTFFIMEEPEIPLSFGFPTSLLNVILNLFSGYTPFFHPLNVGNVLVLSPGTSSLSVLTP